MSLVGNIADVITEIGTQLKSLGSRVTTLEDADILDGANQIAIVSALPETPDANTVYLVFPAS